MRVFYIELVLRLARRQKRIHIRLLGDIDGFRRMGEDKSIENQHSGQKHLLCNLEGLDYGIKDFLVAFAVNLKPTSISLCQAISLLRPD